MSSTIGVQNIAHTNGTNAMTVSSGGNVAMASGKTFSAAGHVLQVVSQTTLAVVPNISSTSYHSSGLTLSITPSSASSKILISFSTSIYNSAGGFVNVSIHRNITSSTSANTQVSGGTNLDTSSNSYGLSHGYSQTGSQIAPASAIFLDSPSSTNVQTYTLTYKSAGGTSCAIFSNNQPASLIAQEIGG